MKILETFVCIIRLFFVSCGLIKNYTMNTEKIKIENYLHNINQINHILSKGVYKLYFEKSNNFYIGSTTENFKQRFRRHIHDLKLNKHCNILLQRAYNKYGIPNIEILEICSSENCIKREQHYLNTLKPYYNICKKAGNTLGVKMKPEVLEKKSIKVDAFDLEGNFIKTFKSITEACKVLNADANNVSKSMKKETTISNNYQFRIHGKYEKIDPYEKSTSDKVLVYLITGEFYKQFPSKLAAANELNLDIGGIVKNIQGKYSSVKNYIFKSYEKDYPLMVTPYLRSHKNQKRVIITDFYTKEVFEFDSFNKVPPEICYKNVITKGLKEYKGEDFIIKNRYIVQTKSHKINEIMSNIYDAKMV